MKKSKYMGTIAGMGCIVCGAEAELHHPRFAAGMSQRANDYFVIPMCPEHHRTGGHGIAIHAGQTTFERMYGTEEQLLAETLKRFISSL